MFGDAFLTTFRCVTAAKSVFQAFGDLDELKSAGKVLVVHDLIDGRMRKLV